MDDVTIEGSTVIFNSGQTLISVHSPENCAGRVCPIHNPSNHELRGYPLSFNGRHMIREIDGELFIDPDDYYYLKYGEAILRNSATCALCDSKLVSYTVHDWVTCSCQAIFIDGGVNYLRRGEIKPNALIDTSKVASRG